MDPSEFKWNALKNERLKKTRGVSFEEIVLAQFVDIEKHPSNEFQERMFFEWKGYIWVVPFVREGGAIFLKTVYPSRKHTKKYKGSK